MKRLAGLLVLLVLAASVPAQNRSRIYTRPTVPSREALDRLNLKLAWYTYLPVEGQRDGINTVQVLGDQVLVQMRSGLIAVLNAANGHTQWRARVGTPYRVTHALGHNARSIFVVNAARIFALDRATGQLEWEYDLGTAPSATPAVDNEQLYACLTGGILAVYRLPGAIPGPAPESDRGHRKRDEKPAASPTSPYSPAPALPLKPAESPRSRTSAKPEPLPLWLLLTDTRLEQTPLLTTEFVFLAGADGTFFATSKHSNHVVYRFRSTAPGSAPLGQHDETAYVASRDFNIYAVDIVKGSILWRFTGGAPIGQKPVVTDEDIYMSPDRAGLYRLRRETGELLWRNTDAEYFLAVNPKFVYALDRGGRLLVLDRARGTRLAAFDTRDFTVPISNDVTDRMFLAAHNGLLLCLYDREYPTPVRVNTASVKKPQKPAKGEADESKPEEARPPARKGEDKQPEG